MSWKGEPSRDVIKKVASLTAFHSKMKKGGKVSVIYTQAKNVGKGRGAKPGSVIVKKEIASKFYPASLGDEPEVLYF